MSTRKGLFAGIVCLGFTNQSCMILLFHVRSCVHQNIVILYRSKLECKCRHVLYLNFSFYFKLLTNKDQVETPVIAESFFVLLYF